MKIALVYDRVNKFGGAERVLLNLHRIWPDAPLFTAFYDPVGASWADVFDVRTSFIGKIPLVAKNHEYFSWGAGFIFEQFNFDGYDIVISVTSAEAKAVLTKPKTLHICYCLTPTRYFWSGYSEYVQRPAMGSTSTFFSWGLKKSISFLREMDLVAAARPDEYIAISNVVKKRIERYYRRKVSSVIYPPCDLTDFKAGKLENPLKEKYYLTVSRLVGYKRLDIVIDVFNQLGWTLVIIGNGRQEKYLRQKAKPNIRFVNGDLTDQQLVNYYNFCQAFVFAGTEDFGLTAAEAQAFGKPVIAYGKSGVSEIVVDGKSGILFDRQNKQCMIDALYRAINSEFSRTEIKHNAGRFSAEKFREKFAGHVYNLYQLKMKGQI